MDPIERITPAKDTTFGMMLSAAGAGHSIFYIQHHNLYLQDNEAHAVMHEIRVYDRDATYFEIIEELDISLRAINKIFMRSDPPVDKRYIYATQILEKAEKQGTMVINSPRSLRRYNEKLYATEFPDLIPETLMTGNKDKIREFLDRHKSIVLKPVGLMAGKEIFLLKDDDVNFDVICDIQTIDGTYPAIAQPFLPAIKEGDRRLLVINGQAYPLCMSRLPKTGSIRANLAAGGNFQIQKLSESEKEIASIVGPRLKQDGVLFAGLDIIGGKLIEINHTSPTGLREISREAGEDITQILFDL